jgi:hypothetical protein
VTASERLTRLLLRYKTSNVNACAEFLRNNITGDAADAWKALRLTYSGPPWAQMEDRVRDFFIVVTEQNRELRRRNRELEEESKVAWREKHGPPGADGLMIYWYEGKLKRAKTPATREKLRQEIASLKRQQQEALETWEREKRQYREGLMAHRQDDGVLNDRNKVPIAPVLTIPWTEPMRVIDYKNATATQRHVWEDLLRKMRAKPIERQSGQRAARYGMPTNLKVLEHWLTHLVDEPETRNAYAWLIHSVARERTPLEAPVLGEALRRICGEGVTLL